MLSAVVLEKTNWSVALFGQSDYRINGFPVSISLSKQAKTESLQKIEQIFEMFQSSLVYSPDYQQPADPRIRTLLELILFSFWTRSQWVRSGDCFLHSNDRGFYHPRTKIQALTWRPFRSLTFGF